MKKMVLMIVLLALLLSACAMQKQEDNKSKPPGELEKIETSFSSLYRIMFQNGNETFQIAADLEDTADSIAVSAGFSSVVTEGTENDEQERYLNKVYYYLKEILKLMENTRPELLENRTVQELGQYLDNTVNRLCYQINQNDYHAAMKSVNDGIYLISAILKQYGENGNACALKLEYCLNLIEIEAAGGDVDNALDLTDQVIGELAEASEKECEDQLNGLSESVDSLRNAASYHDPQLIRMKTEIMRENLKNIMTFVK